MEIRFTKEEILDLLKKYYKEKENVDVDVSVSVTQGRVGLYETIECAVRFIVKKTINILDYEKSVTITLCEDEVCDIINKILNSTIYTVTSLKYDAGILHRPVGCYDNMEYQPYFNGIIANIKLKEQKARKLKENIYVL